MAIPSGFPNASNTGVPAGTALTAYSGPKTITTDGTVIEGKIITGSLRVTGDNVVIKNCTITFSDWWGIDAEGAKNIIIQDCKFVGPGYSGDSNAAILGSGTFLRNDISKAENGIVLQGGASTVKGNYIHDLEDGGGDPHYDGISVQGGQNGVLIEGNTVLARDTSDIFIKNDFGDINNVTVKHNFLGGTPGINIYVDGRGPNGVITNVTITDNYLIKGYYDYYSIDKSSPVISGNHEYLPGAIIPDPTPSPDPDPTPTPDPDPTPTPDPTPDPTPTPEPTSHTFWGTRGDDVLPATGQSNSGNDEFYARSGNDVISGGAGADTIDGGWGTDTSNYAESKIGVKVDLQAHTSSGGDAAGDVLTRIENLVGSSYADKLTGDSGDNVLDGGAGADILRGGAGDDVYIVDNAGDIVDEGVAGSDGSDTVKSWISFGLTDTSHVLGAVGNLTLLGSGNVNGTGNALETRLIGNSGDNVLDGGAGDDVITGGAGHDTFVFSDPLSEAKNVDRITDFSPSDDTIQLDNAVFSALTPASTLASGALYIGAAAHDASDRIIYNSETGALTYDYNGNAAGGAIQFATLDTGVELTNGDFEVI